MENTISQKKTFKERIFERYQITGWWPLIVILFVFSVTGSLSVWVSKPVLAFCGVSSTHMNPFLYWPLRILITFPIYQILLITIGSLCGQYKFFWQMEKKMIQRFVAPFKRK